MKSSSEVKLLGVTIDKQLSFYPHVMAIRKHASSKTKALMRIKNYLSDAQANVLVNAFILSAFNYCPLIWMFCSKMAHNLINSTHRRILCAKTGSFSSSLEDLLAVTNSVSIHTRNLRLLMTEVFRTLNRLNPAIMWDTFQTSATTYSLRCGSTLVIPRIKKALGVNSFDFRASMGWNALPAEVKEAETIAAFKNALSKVTICCTCKHCCKR